MKRNVDGVIFVGADTGGRVDQLSDRFSFDAFEKLFGFSGLSLGLAPTGCAMVGMKDADSQLGWPVAVNASARIAANLTRPGDADGPKFNAINAMLRER